MIIKNQEIKDGALVKITDQRNKVYIGLAYDVSFIKQLLGYKIGLTIAKRTTALDYVRHELFPFKEKHIREIKVLKENED